MAIIDTEQRLKDLEASFPEGFKARKWRNKELKSTDYIVSLMDFTPHQDWLDYRQQLRDWPSTGGFPVTRPNKPDRETPSGY